MSELFTRDQLLELLGNCPDCGSLLVEIAREVCQTTVSYDFDLERGEYTGQMDHTPESDRECEYECRHCLATIKGTQETIIAILLHGWNDELRQDLTQALTC